MILENLNCSFLNVCIMFVYVCVCVGIFRRIFLKNLTEKSFKSCSNILKYILLNIIHFSFHFCAIMKASGWKTLNRRKARVFGNQFTDDLCKLNNKQEIIMRLNWNYKGRILIKLIKSHIWIAISFLRYFVSP